MLPLLSIGITTYKRLDRLKNLVFSIINQPFQDFEILIGNDDENTHISYEILGIFDNRIKIINNLKNLGELSNMNSLLLNSNGKYFSWIYDDDFINYNYLEFISSVILNNKNINHFFTSYEYCYNIKTTNILYPKPNIQYFKGDEFLNKCLEGKIKTISTSAFYNREMLISEGGAKDILGISIALYSEYELLFRLQKVEQLVFIDSPLVYFSISTESWSASSTNVNIFYEAGVNLFEEALIRFKNNDSNILNYRNLNLIFNSTFSQVIKKDIITNSSPNIFLYYSYVNDINNLFKNYESKFVFKKNDILLKLKISFYIFHGYLRKYSSLRLIYIYSKLVRFIPFLKKKLF
jgi:glycosyltransferase involved in cell wall biosynthesis